MKNAKYKLFLFGTLMCLFLSCFTAKITVFALEEEGEVAEARIGNEEYETLSKALDDWTDGTTLTLLKDVSVSYRLDVEGTKTLDLNGHTLHGDGIRLRTLRIEKEATLTLSDSSAGGTGKLTGGGVRVNGTLIMTGGSITENYFEEDGGGGVLIDGDGSGKMIMTGGSVTNNSAEENGGGICVRGSLELGGNAYVGENTKQDEDNNIYLPSGKKVSLNAFEGTASVTVTQVPAVCAEGTLAGSGALKADNPLYTVTEREGVFTAVLSPLSKLQAKLKDDVVIYPTTPLDDIKEMLEVVGFNENGVAYPDFTYTVDGTLQVGNCELTVLATGSNSETVKTVLTVPVSAPKLLRLNVSYEEQENVYFDSDISIITAGITVTGEYSDGVTRTVCATAEETSELCGESYITDYYRFSIDFSNRTDGKARATVTVGTLSQTVSVGVSTYTVDVSEIEVVNVTVAQALDLTLSAFTPSLPSGIACLVKLNGEPLDISSLKAGVYQVSISFRLTDSDNYVLVGGERSATLTVNFDAVESGEEDGKAYIITAEGGVLPSWKFTVTAVDPSVDIEGNYEARQAVEITLRENGYIVANPDREITVKLLLNEKIRSKDVLIYRVMADGTTQQIDCSREGDYVVFRADGVSQTQYVVAVENGYSAYLICSIVFGVVCLAAATALLWYLISKRNLKK